MGSGIEAAITVKPSYGLGDDDIARMLQESFGASDQDMHARALREQQVEAQRLLEATIAAVASDGDLLSTRSAARSSGCWRQCRRCCRAATCRRCAAPPRR